MDNQSYHTSQLHEEVIIDTVSGNNFGVKVRKALTRVLVIGEDSTTPELLKSALNQELFEVLSAPSVREGLDAVKEKHPHLIILDLTVPGNDGCLLCKKIREFSQLPILVLSIYRKPAIVAKMLDGGADGFLIKPVPNDVLVANINNLTRRAQAERGAFREK